MSREYNTEISERIQQLIDYHGVSKNKFAKNLGYNRSQSIYDITENKKDSTKKPTNPSFDFFQRLFNSEYSEMINPSWLFTGKGEMHLSKATPARASLLANIEKNNSLTPIPLLSVEVIGGFGNSSFMIKEEDVEAYYLIPEFKHKNIDFMMRVRGKSMSPCYDSGDIVACGIIRSSNFLQWNRIHVIATKEQGIILKRIKKGSDNNTLKLVSDNLDYEPFEIPKSEITGIAVVEGGVKLE